MKKVCVVLLFNLVIGDILSFKHVVAAATLTFSDCMKNGEKRNFYSLTDFSPPPIGPDRRLSMRDLLLRQKSIISLFSVSSIHEEEVSNLLLFVIIFTVNRPKKYSF